MADAVPSPPPKRRLMADSLSTPPSNGTTSNSSKRSKHHAPPPLVVPAGHAPLRMLCHASLIGGFIGKSGSSIKQLQLETGSKIRVEDSLQPGSDDRVIVIVAPSNPFKKLKLRNEDNGDGEEREYEVSAVQEAALRVLEKILEEDGAVKTASCRFLVEDVQAGSVIGKGGKMVEKLKRESGAKIRVLLGDHLPPGVIPPDEVVEIEGDVLAVKKALLGVSGCLQECPQVEKSSSKDTRPSEYSSLPSVLDFHVDPLMQLTPLSVATTSSSPTMMRRPLPFEADRLVISESKSQQQEVVFKILCSVDRVGGVIGKGGSIIRALQDETGASISVGPSVADCDERLITITSQEDVEARYSPAQRAVVLVFSRSVEVGAEKGLETRSTKGSSVSARLLVPSNQAGCLLGKGGAIISEMRKATGTGIHIIHGDQVPKCASEDDEVVEISGQFVNVQDALYQVTGRLRSNLFPSKPVSVPGSRTHASLIMDASVHGRVGELEPIRLHRSYVTSHSMDRQAAIRQGVDPLLRPHRLDHSPSPGLRSPEIAAARGNPRTFGNLGRGLASANGRVEVSSANRPAIITSTTVEILIPETAISSVYGENGSNLARIRQISGAKVVVHEAQPGTRSRTVVISGTPDETQAAQSLLHAFILTGPC